MSLQKAQIVRSLAGHDAGGLFLVLETGEGCVYVVDGKRRRVEQPKRKNVRHVAPLGVTHPIMETIRAGEPVRNRQIREALAAVSDEMEV